MVKIKAVTPDLTMHFENDMIILEKWKQNKPISAIYFDGNKERYYVKRFIIESVDKEELFISEHEKIKIRNYSYRIIGLWLKLFFQKEA